MQLKSDPPIHAHGANLRRIARSSSVRQPIQDLLDLLVGK
jgi:hypothetical protein